MPGRALFTLLLLAAVAARAEPRIEHLEPAFWWTGMRHGGLEILVHGERISELEPEIDYAGVTLDDVHRTGNPDYLFLELSVTEDARPGRFDIRFERAGRTELVHPYELKAREPGSAERRGFDASDVIYLITPDRFANGDPANDEIAGLREGPDRADPHGRHGGDLQGIIDHLDYIEDMGYTQVWLNPVLENDQPEQSYHGYATTDFYQVDPRFGTNELYRRLADAARQRGIGLIMDVILNHCGSEHWWMDDLPAADWINHGGEFVATTHDRTSLFDPHGAAGDRRRFADGWFVPSMPDLNQRNPRLAAYLIQMSIWWVEYAGLSGLRVDTWPYSDKEFLAEWGRRLTTEYPHLNIVGEEWLTNPAMVAYWQRGSLRRDGYESYLPSLMDFPLQDAVIRGLTEEEGWGTGLDRIYRTLANDFLYADPYNLVIFPDNHDMSRIHTQLGERDDLWRMSLVFFVTTRGIPQLYYGDEILMTNRGTDAHGVIRSDFPGGWAGDAVNAFTGEGLTERQREAQAFTRRLLDWRRTARAVHRGTLTQFDPEDGVYVYFRHGEGGTVMVALNNADVARSIELERFVEVLGAARSAHDVLEDTTVQLSDRLQVPARSARVLELVR
jgi:glycosidase